MMDLGIMRDIRLSPEEDTVRSLYDIVMEFRDGTLQLPEHQREMKWDLSKRREWIARLRSSIRPIGVIATYELDNGKASPVYVNDGSHRIRVCVEYLSSPSVYNDTEEAARDVLKKTRITIQHRHYKTSQEAYRDFQLINLGTTLNAYEFNKGILATMPDYKTLWGPIFDAIILATERNRNRVCNSGASNRPKTVDTYKRDSLASFYRFVSGLEIASNIQITAMPKPQDVNQKRSFEWDLRGLLESSDIEDIRKEVQRFEKMVIDETALIEKIIYQDMGWSRGRGIFPTLYQWLISAAAWRRNVNVPLSDWYQFVSRLIELGSGKSSIEGTPKMILSYQRLAEIGRVSRLTEVDLTRYKPGNKSKGALKNGWHNSHEVPFVSNGDGPTVPEPGLLNMARGANPITKQEMESLLL